MVIHTVYWVGYGHPKNLNVATSINEIKGVHRISQGKAVNYTVRRLFI